MQFSKQTIIALTPFLLATPSIAMPLENVERDQSLVKRFAWLAVLDGFGIAAGVVDTIKSLIEGADESDPESSSPKPIKDIAPEPGRPKRVAEVVCITGQKAANPEWFRTQMKAHCEKIVEEEPQTYEDRYDGMIGEIWSETAEWGQELNFEMAWKSGSGKQDGDSYTEPLSVHMCTEMVDAVSDVCRPSTYEGEAQTQGGHVLWNQEMLFTLDVTE